MYMILGLKSNKITTIVDRNFTVFENIRPDIILAEDQAIHISWKFPIHLVMANHL